MRVHTEWLAGYYLIEVTNHDTTNDRVVLAMLICVFFVTNSYFTALHGYASVLLAAAAGETPAYP